MSTNKKGAARAVKKTAPATGEISTKAKKGEAVKVSHFSDFSYKFILKISINTPN